MLNVIDMDNKNILNINIEVPFSSARIAQLAYDVLRVDGEPKRSGVTKKLIVSEHILKAEFSANLARQLRVAINGFFEKLDLISETIDCFGDPPSEPYKY